MKLVIVIALVLAIVAVRLAIPPWPNFLKMVADRRWSKRTTVALFAIALVGATVAVVISKH
jgi:Mn2+/Fe2+ NRAMP family transporter